MNINALSQLHRKIIEQCQMINFGQIAFFVRNGQPDPNAHWSTIRTVKIPTGDNEPRPEHAVADFMLRKEHIALIQNLVHLPNGSRVTIEVKHGLPFLIEIEQNIQAA